MKISLFLIGDEIISGKREDINAHFLMKKLGETNQRLHMILISGDEEKDIMDGVKFLLSKSDIVITSGGLGLTPDDITVKSVAKALKRKTVSDSRANVFIKNSLKRIGRTLKKEMENSFSEIIKGAVPLENLKGVAPGEKLAINGKLLFVFPGVPFEFADMTERYVMPLIKYANQKETYKTTYLISARESEVVEVLKEIEEKFGIKIASYPPVTPKERFLKIKLIGEKDTVQKAGEFFENEVNKRGIKIEEKISR